MWARFPVDLVAQPTAQHKRANPPQQANWFRPNKFNFIFRMESFLSKGLAAPSLFLFRRGKGG